MLVSMNVTVMQSYNTPAGPPFAGVSFSYQPPPSLTSISGCEGSGPGTYGCLPHSTVLTLRGSGFHWYFKSNGDRIAIGNVSYWLQPGAVYDITLIVLNDTAALVPLNRSYLHLLPPYQYGGQVLPIRLTIPQYNESSERFVAVPSNSLSISFVPLPAPIITLISSQTSRQNGKCVSNSSGATWPVLNCEPVFSSIWVQAWYSYGAVITVGGYPCESQSYLRLWPPAGLHLLAASHPVLHTGPAVRREHEHGCRLLHRAGSRRLHWLAPGVRHDLMRGDRLSQQRRPVPGGAARARLRRSAAGRPEPAGAADQHRQEQRRQHSDPLSAARLRQQLGRVLRAARLQQRDAGRAVPGQGPEGPRGLRLHPKQRLLLGRLH